jgi:hypothetical protein
MSSSLNAATGQMDAPADIPPPATSSTGLESLSRPAPLFDAAALRPAPANWRGCGFRRPWTTPNGGRAD